jgi:hypothetical protein
MTRRPQTVNTSKQSDKALDVVKFKPSPASSTSRQIISSHGPIMQDPTILNEQNGGLPADATAAEEEPATVNGGSVNIQPREEFKDEAKLVANVDGQNQPEDASAQPEVALSSDENAPQPVKPQEAKPEVQAESGLTGSEPEPQPDKAAASPIDSANASDQNQTNPSNEGQPDSQSSKEMDQEALARAAQLDQLVSSGKYFLPVNMVVKRKNKQALVIGAIICIVLAVVWFDVALDAGLIHDAWHLPHTHFFSLKS